MNKSIKKLLNIFQFLFLLVCLYFLFNSLYASKETLAKVIAAAKPGYLFLSFLLWSVLALIAPLFSHEILRQYHKRITRSDFVKIYIQRLPAKYIPGGIWHTVARGHDLLKKGLTKKQLSLLVFYENFWPVVMTALIGGGGVLLSGSEGLWKTTATILFAMSLLILLSLIMLHITTWVLPLQTYLRISLINIIFWLLAALSFLSYSMAFNLTSFQPAYLINYMFSWLIGFLSFFSPQGIGVFELTMTQLTPFPVSPREAMVIIAGFRLIILVSDVTNWLLCTCFQKIVARHSPLKS